MKAASIILITGIILIVFNDWIENSKISIGFDKINDTLMPFYVGIILAFLTCPLFNWIVIRIYKRLTAGLKPYTPAFIHPDTASAKAAEYEQRDHAQENRTALMISKTIASIVAFFVVIGVVALLVYSVFPKLIEGSGSFISSLPDKIKQLTDWATTSLADFPALQRSVTNFADKGVMEIYQWLQTNVLNNENASSLVTAISNGIVSMFNVAFEFLMGLLIMLYLLNNKEHIFAIGRKLVASCCSEKRSEGIYEFVSIFNETFIGYIVGRIIDSVIIGVLTYIVLLIFNISFAPMIAVIVGVTNVIPFFGPFMGAIPSALMLLLEDPTQSLYFIIIILIIQQLDGNVIGPKVVGDAIGISSFWTLVAVLIGGGLFGFMGMAFGTPVFALIYRYVDKIAIRKLKEKDKKIATMDYYNLDPYKIDMDEIEMSKPAKKKQKHKFKDVLDKIKKADEAENSDGIENSAEAESSDGIEKPAEASKAAETSEPAEKQEEE